VKAHGANPKPPTPGILASMTASRVVDGIRLVPGPPGLDDYLRLRAESGLTPKSREQGAAAVNGAWSAVHVVDTATGETVGMGRVIGDGGWYFHVIDMAVLPSHQRRGIGAAVLETLLDDIATRAPADPYVTLMADEPGRPLYRRFGFEETGPRTVGMALTRRL
jgi:ribosomal protein S18 acetylase RimI-like enzyme